MPNTRKFFKTTITFEVLTEDGPLPDITDLDAIHFAITSGDASGMITERSSVELTPREAAQALMKQGSDPGFFMLDEEGNRAE